MKRNKMFGGLIAALALAAQPALAETYLNSFPYSENFDANNYASSIWLSTGATHTWLPTGGWRGTGAAKFTPPSIQGYSGLGQFILSRIPSSQRGDVLSVRFLIYHGSTWRENSTGGKLLIMNREGNGGRPMIIYNQYPNPQGSVPASQVFESMGACDGTVCKYDSGGYWAGANDRLRVGDAPLSREREWISVELEANARSGTIRLFVDTQDGDLSGLYVEQSMVDSGPGGIWSYVDIIGGHQAPALAVDAETYVLIDELVISNQHIGPPSGFGIPSQTPRSPVLSVR